MARPKLVISIINFRTEKLTRNCVTSVLEDIKDLPAEIVVVDNLSGDGSAEALGAWIDTLGPDAPVRLIKSKTNSGFSGGIIKGSPPVRLIIIWCSIQTRSCGLAFAAQF